MLFAGTMANVNAQSIKWMKKQSEFKRSSHIKDQEQFSIGGGQVNGGYNACAAYGKYVSKNLLFRTDLFYETVKLGLTTLHGYYLSPEINYTINKIGNQLFINVKGGVLVGREDMNNSIMVNKKLNKIVFGEKIGIKFEYYITPEVSLNIDLEQRFINNSMAGTMARNCYLSLSYNF
jgi:hypothetical protein